MLQGMGEAILDNLVTGLCTVFPRIKAGVFISFPVFLTHPLNKGGYYSRPGIYFQ